MAATNPQDIVSICLGRGNKKVGLAWTFSLPSRMTCPGASTWCFKHCYAWRLENLRPNCRRAYLENLLLSIDKEDFVRQMLEALPEDAGAVRIHVGGDFYSESYCKSWIEICKARPRVQFWSYTRSWNVPGLRTSVETLRDLPNVQLFASTDESMPLPPEGWRVAWIANDKRAQGLHCPEQQDRAASCMACTYCLRDRKGDVVFQVH